MFFNVFVFKERVHELRGRLHIMYFSAHAFQYHTRPSQFVTKWRQYGVKPRENRPKSAMFLATHFDPCTFSSSMYSSVRNAIDDPTLDFSNPRLVTIAPIYAWNGALRRCLGGKIKGGVRTH